MICYLYMHERQDTGMPFYVGKGSNNRVNSKKDRNQHWRNTVAKVGYNPKIVYNNITHTHALNAEKFTIALFRKFFKLVNQTEGGDGGNGLKGEKHPLYGKIRSDEVKKKLSNALKGRSFPHCSNRKGTTQTAETKAKISAALKGKPKSAEHIKNASEASRLSLALKRPKKEKVYKPHGLLGKKLSKEHIKKSSDTRKLNNLLYPERKRTGEKAPCFKGWYLTPLGEFNNAIESGKIFGLTQQTIIRKCKGRIINGKFLQPQNGWAFKQKV